ncbi:MFS transporter [Chloroflexota bacterium]
MPLVSLAARWFLKRRSVATGIIISGIGIGTLIGPPSAEFLISIYDWRQSYLILGITVLILVISAAQFMKRDPAQIGQTPYGENTVEEQGLELEINSLTLKEVMAIRQFWLVMGMVFCNGFIVFIIMVHIVPHATEIGFSSTSAARVLAAIGGLSIAGKIAMGFAADRIGSKQSFIISFILMSAALFWLLSIKDLWLIYIFAVVFAFGYGSCSVSQPPLVAKLFGLNSHGAIMGVVTLGYSTGAAVGPLIAGYIFDINGSYQGAFLVSAAVGIICLILATLVTAVKTK